MGATDNRGQAEHHLQTLLGFLKTADHVAYESETRLLPNRTHTQIDLQIWHGEKKSSCDRHQILSGELQPLILATVGDPVEMPNDGSQTQIVFPYESFSVQNFSKDDLLKLREQINVRLFDLERQPAM